MERQSHLDHSRRTLLKLTDASNMIDGYLDDELDSQSSSGHSGLPSVEV